MTRPTVRPTRSFVAASASLAVAAALGCATGAPGGPPLAHDATRWEYLASRYDADGDGRIEASEYGRGADAHGRLDVDGDGVVTAADFEARGPTPRDALAQALLHRFFQAEEDPEALSAEDVEATLVRRDADGDGRLGRDELAGLLAELRGEEEYPTVVAALLTDTTEFDALLAVVDGDGDGLLASSELADYLRDAYDPMLVRMVQDPPPDEAEEADGPAPGEPAPDFTLRPPDGGAPVSLSSFAGERPVALIFGSYT